MRFFRKLLLSGNENLKILDFGCGTGDFANRLSFLQNPSKISFSKSQQWFSML
jgi:hypothetical protein